MPIPHPSNMCLVKIPTVDRKYPILICTSMKDIGSSSGKFINFTKYLPKIY